MLSLVSDVRLVLLGISESKFCALTIFVEYIYQNSRARVQANEKC